MTSTASICAMFQSCKEEPRAKMCRGVGDWFLEPQPPQTLVGSLEVDYSALLPSDSALCSRKACVGPLIRANARLFFLTQLAHLNTEKQQRRHTPSDAVAMASVRILSTRHHGLQACRLPARRKVYGIREHRVHTQTSVVRRQVTRMTDYGHGDK